MTIENGSIPSEFEGLEGTVISSEGEQEIGSTEAPAAPTPPLNEFDEPEAPAAPAAPVPTPTPTGDPSPTPTPQVSLKDIFGEEIDTEQARTRYTEIQSQNKNLTEQIESLKQTISSSPAAKYDAFIKATGIDDYSTFQKVSGLNLDSTEVDPIELLVLSRRIEKGGKMTTEEESSYRNHLLRTYKQDSGSFTDEEIQGGKFELEDRIRDVKPKISEILSKISSSTPVDTQKQMQELASEWEPAVTTMLSDAKASKLSISVKGEEGTLKLGDEQVEIPVVFDIPKDQVEKAYSDAKRMAIQAGLKPTAETQAKIQAYVQATLEQANAPKIYAKVATLAFEKAAEHWAKQTHNPSAITPPGVKPEDQQREKSDSDLIYEMEMGQG